MQAVAVGGIEVVGVTKAAFDLYTGFTSTYGDHRATGHCAYSQNGGGGRWLCGNAN